MSKLSSVYNDTSGARVEHMSSQNTTTSVRTTARTDMSPEFIRFLWEQQKIRDTGKEAEAVYPTTLFGTPFLQGATTLNSTFQSNSFTLSLSHTNSSPIFQSQTHTIGTSSQTLYANKNISHTPESLSPISSLIAEK